MLNVLIVEDDYEDMKYCATLIGQLGIEVNLLQAGTGGKAMDLLLENDVDIAFIDVMLPDMDGLELANRIRSIEKYGLLHIIFVTAVADKQLQAYKTYHCYDYIVKPIDPAKFYDAIGSLFNNIIKMHDREGARTVIYVETDDAKRIIPMDDILFVESAGRRVDIYTTGEKIANVKLTLKEAIEYIDSAFFVRCHKSFAVNLRMIKSLRQVEKRTWDVEFIKKTEYPCYVGRAYRNSIEEKLMGQSIKGS